MAEKFRDNESYVIMYFLSYVATKTVAFSWLQGCSSICLISSAVTYEDYHNQYYELSFLLALGEVEVILGEISSRL